jgi:hypothetical protein
MHSLACVILYASFNLSALRCALHQWIGVNRVCLLCNETAKVVASGIIYIQSGMKLMTAEKSLFKKKIIEIFHQYWMDIRNLGRRRDMLSDSNSIPVFINFSVSIIVKFHVFVYLGNSFTFIKVTFWSRIKLLKWFGHEKNYSMNFHRNFTYCTQKAVILD